MRMQFVTNHPPQKAPKHIALVRPFGVVFLLAGMAMGLAACGSTTAPPGSTNVNYGAVNDQGNVTTTTRPNMRKKPENSAAGAMVAIPFKPIPSDTLKGLSEDDVENKIGPPEMIRGEGDIRVWQYRSDKCSFDAFFVPGAEGSKRELRHMLARMRRGNQAITVQDCLDQVLKMNLGRG